MTRYFHDKLFYVINETVFPAYTKSDFCHHLKYVGLSWKNMVQFRRVFTERRDITFQHVMTRYVNARAHIGNH